MFLALMFGEPTAASNLDVTYRGQLISSLPCNHGVSVSDVRASPAADVVFHDKYAELTFVSVYDEERTLFVYVDGLKVALITAKGPVRMLVPLAQRANHKIVTGNTNIAGGLHSAWAVCN